MRANISIPSLAVTVGLILSNCLDLRAADWPQFLGPNRNGTSSATNLINAIPAGGLPEVWRVAGGVGMSAVAVSEGQAVTMVQTAGQQRLLVLDAETGTTKHDVAIAPLYRNSMGNGPRATPCLADGVAYVHTGEGILAAVKLDGGQILWKRNICSALQSKPAEYGMACSPLLVGDAVVVTVGAKQGCVVACDRHSGEFVWKAGSDRTGYSSPALLEIGSRKQIVAFTGNSVLGIGPKSGDVLWRHPFETGYDCNIATPILYKGNVYVSAGENHGALLLKIDGDKAQEVWSSLGTGSLMRNEWQTSIIVGKHLYGLNNVGAAGPVTHLSCLDLETGELAWSKKRFGKSNMVAADGKLFFSTMAGELVIVRIDPGAYQELGRQEVIGTTRQAPSIAGRHLFLRDDKEILCLDIGA